MPGLDAQRVQELFSYLLLHRGRVQSRETLAEALWEENSTEQPRKHLRQALWQLQAALDERSARNVDRVLRVEPDWMELNLQAPLWLDVAVFEETFALVSGVPYREIQEPAAAAMREAVQLYRGDLLEGCYLEWCLGERERLRMMLLVMLDKLAGYCETRQEYETGLHYGLRSLEFDRADERTHRNLMRLLYLAGDRTGALRQYARCVAALRDQLGVTPSRCTHALYEQIRADQLEEVRPPVAGSAGVPEPLPDPVNQALCRLEHVLTMLTELQHQFQHHLQADELSASRRPPSAPGLPRPS